MQALLELRPRATAVLCANDLMAVGAMAAARMASCRVPDEIAVNRDRRHRWIGDVSPALTTVRIPSRDIGRITRELLLQRIGSDAPRAPRTVLVAHEIVPRMSA
jgi:LacI family transcriptional regulator